MNADFYIIGVWDSSGKMLAQTVCEEIGDSIFLTFKYNGKIYAFEAEAYHLPIWVKNRGFRYFLKGYDYSQLPKPKGEQYSE